ncbi:olfactory receptor 5I1-like [Dendropsophus ebraccatus]|uniref:olfactory receptor 5I1-like n=1 Tax=Dendropsophus ebraccatus TaxID=150705 RepID=UPI00383219B5
MLHTLQVSECSVQLSLQQTFECKRKYTATYPYAQALNVRIGKLLSMEMLPNWLVETEAFQNLMAVAVPRYSSCHYFSLCAIPALHQHVSENISALTNACVWTEEEDLVEEEDMESQPIEEREFLRVGSLAHMGDFMLARLSRDPRVQNIFANNDYWVFTLLDSRYKQNFSTLIPVEERSFLITFLMGLSKTSNYSFVHEFILTGFSERSDLRIFLSLMFLFIYLISVWGNAGILILVSHNVKFHIPMYFFISNLSLIDLVYSSNIVPKILVGLIFNQKSISYLGCAIQLFLYCALGSTECILFAVMAYDRYMAICNPLTYNILMQQKTCLILVLVAYVPGFLHSLIEICCTFRLSFCESNVLHHFVCDFPPLLKISCSDTTVNEMIIFICSSSIIIPCIIFILVSYGSIFIVVLKITAAGGRQKAFSTCSSHITAVTLFYGTLLSVYVSPKSLSSTDNVHMATIFYTVILPMLNPLIYSLRNKDIKSALTSTIIVKCHSGGRNN